MMTEQAGHSPTLMESGAPAFLEPEPTTDDIIIRGDNTYKEPQPTTDDVVVRGDNVLTLEIETQASQPEIKEDDLERAVAWELGLLTNWLGVKVKDELMVQLFKNGLESEINLPSIAVLLKSLLKDEQDSRLQNALRIERFDIPKAELTPIPSGGAYDYSQFDLDKLNFHYDVQMTLVDEVRALEPANEAGYLEMAENYVERIIAEARHEVSVLQSKQSAGRLETPADDTELLHDEVVELLTKEAQKLAV